VSVSQVLEIRESLNALNAVLLMIGLIIVGLVIDLGGGPDHHRRGFQANIPLLTVIPILFDLIVLEEPRRCCSSWSCGFAFIGSLPSDLVCAGLRRFQFPRNGSGAYWVGPIIFTPIEISVGQVAM
jgi:hypothetical protein